MNNLKFNIIVIIIIIIIIMTNNFIPSEMSNWSEVSAISFSRGIIQKQGFHQIFKNDAEYCLAQLTGLW